MMLLSIQDLKVRFRMGRQGGVQQYADAVRFDSFDVPETTVVALVGESGSGKSVTAMSVLNLLPDNAERSGRMLWQGRDLLQASAWPSCRALRGKRDRLRLPGPDAVAEPGARPSAAQLVEPLMKHMGIARPRRAQACRAAAGRGRHPRAEAPPEASYPHEMSGGQQQRVMIAMALACEPKLLIADEPTTALDVTIQRQILELLAKLKASHRMSVLFISHDLGVVGEIADNVVVMRHGIDARAGPGGKRIFADPQDAYTKALLACRPSLKRQPGAADGDRRPHRAGRAAPTADGRGDSVVAKPKDPERPGGAGGALAGQELLAEAGPVRQARVQGGAGRQLQAEASGHTLGVVGESRARGKTTMGLTLLRLHEPTAGEVIFDGRNLLEARSDRERQVMRRRIQVVFQNPYASLNPRFTIGQTLVEPMAIHGIGKRHR
jgi:peptide/nickel transport system ATP-binding protein